MSFTFMHNAFLFLKLIQTSSSSMRLLTHKIYSNIRNKETNHSPVDYLDFKNTSVLIVLMAQIMYSVNTFSLKLLGDIRFAKVLFYFFIKYFCIMSWCYDALNVVQCGVPVA